MQQRGRVAGKGTALCSRLEELARPLIKTLLISRPPIPRSPPTTNSMPSPTCACSMRMRKVPTGARSRGSCCTSIRTANLIERGGPSKAISPAPLGTSGHREIGRRRLPFEVQFARRHWAKPEPSNPSC
jgi:hypothetical protein